MHKVLSIVNLPPDNRKGPGDKITKAEWEACDPPQTEEDIQRLIDDGAISEDMDAEIHPDHLPVDPSVPTIARMVENAKMLVEQLGDDAPAEVKKLANLDHSHITIKDTGNGGDAGHVG